MPKPAAEGEDPVDHNVQDAPQTDAGSAVSPSAPETQEQSEDDPGDETGQSARQPIVDAVASASSSGTQNLTGRSTAPKALRDLQHVPTEPDERLIPVSMFNLEKNAPEGPRTERKDYTETEEDDEDPDDE